MKALLKEAHTLEEVTEHFISLLSSTVIPYIQKIEQIYYMKVELSQKEQEHLYTLKTIVTRYLQFEARILERIHNNKLIHYLEEEIIELKKITVDLQGLYIENLEHDFEELLTTLEELHQKVRSLEHKN